MHSMANMELLTDFINPFPSSTFGFRTRPENNFADYMVEASQLRARANTLRQQEQYLAGTPAWMESQRAIAEDQYLRRRKFHGL